MNIDVALPPIHASSRVSSVDQCMVKRESFEMEVLVGGETVAEHRPTSGSDADAWVESVCLWTCVWKWIEMRIEAVD